MSNTLSPNDIVCSDASAYFAIRSCCGELFPLCFAFDLSKSQIHSCSAVLLEDNPSRPFDRDYSDFRKISYSAVMKEFFCPDGSCGDLWEARIAPDDIVAAIAAHWKCSFTEIPLFFPPSMSPNTIRFRLFRPVFGGGKGTSNDVGRR